MSQIELQHVSKRFDTVAAVDDVSFSAPEGKLLVLLGPSGCGKSTVLRMIAGLDFPTAGDVMVNGNKVTGPGADRGMVFQKYTSFEWLTVEQNIEYGMKLKGTPEAERRKICQHLLEATGLTSFAKAYPRTLSGGMQQRVAIARTLAMKPEAILFDEPTSALDPRMAAEVISVITDLAKCGQTMIVVTHAMGFARNVSHTVHVMHAGRVAESGPPVQVFENPHEEVTRSFMAQSRAN